MMSETNEPQPTAFVIPPSMVSLSPIMYRLASHLAYAAALEQFVPAIAMPIGAVLHATASLEAFLNEEIARWIASDAKWDGPLSALDRLEFEQKWLIVPQLLVDGTFDRGAEPFQSMRVLVKLRNKLVHCGVPAHQARGQPQ
jgi:hypothetical protein